MKEKFGWTKGILSDFGEVVSGGTPKTQVAEYWGEDVSWITPADLSGYSEKYIHKGRKSITTLGLKNSSAKLMPKGSVLFSSRAPIGYIVIAGDELCTNQGFKSLIPNKVVNSDFLYYYFKSIKQLAEKRASGTTFKELSGKAFADLPLCLPPLPEQRAIVYKIEQLFSELDNGIANLKLAQEQLKVYRQAVLKKAFEGCIKVPFSELVKSSQNGISKRSGKEGAEFKVLRLADISNLKIDYSSPRCIRLKSSEINKYKLLKDDLVCIRVNGSQNLVGRLIITSEKDDSNDWAFCDHFIRFSLDPSNAVPKYYYYYFQTMEVRQYIHENMVSSAGQNTVSQGTIKSILVPMSSLPEQQAIVQEIETRLSVCDKIEQDIKTNLEKAEALRQSILKKAFEGKLLNEKELAQVRGAEDWEPAEVLLEKIKVEKTRK